MGITKYPIIFESIDRPSWTNSGWSHLDHEKLLPRCVIGYSAGRRATESAGLMRLTANSIPTAAAKPHQNKNSQAEGAWAAPRLPQSGPPKTKDSKGFSRQSACREQAIDKLRRTSNGKVQNSTPFGSVLFNRLQGCRFERDPNRLSREASG
jgi:hypothetical protein